jgi:hypothetical protein
MNMIKKGVALLATLAGLAGTATVLYSCPPLNPSSSGSKTDVARDSGSVPWKNVTVSHGGKETQLYVEPIIDGRSVKGYFEKSGDFIKVWFGTDDNSDAKGRQSAAFDKLVSTFGLNVSTDKNGNREVSGRGPTGYYKHLYGGSVVMTAVGADKYPNRYFLCLSSGYFTVK